MDHLIVSASLAALARAVARTPPSLRDAGPLMRDDRAVAALLEDVLRDRLLFPGPHPELGAEVRIPPPPRDVPFRRFLLLAASVVGDAEVAPAARLALAAAGPRAPHPLRRLALVAESLAPLVDPAAILGAGSVAAATGGAAGAKPDTPPLAPDPRRVEELSRRVAAAFHLSIEGESPEESAARLAAVDSRSAQREAREVDERRREVAIAAAIAAAARRAAPLEIVES